MDDEGTKDELATTGQDSALAKKSLAEQQRAIDAGIDAETAAREERDGSMHGRASQEGYEGTGEMVKVGRRNPAELAIIPQVEAKAAELRSTFLAKRTHGPGQTKLRFHCLSCGWNQTLEFDPADHDDAKVLENDIATYAGPCPAEGCGYMTLVPYDGLGHMDTFNEIAARQRAEEAGIVADSVLDRIEDRVGNVVLGAAAGAVQMHGEGQDGDAAYPGGSPPESDPVLPADATDT